MRQFKLKHLLPTPPHLREFSWLLALWICLFLIALSTIVQKSFFDSWTVVSNLKSFMPLIVVAIGQTFVILSGDIDLSIGAVTALANVTLIRLVELMGQRDDLIVAAIAMTLALTLLCGLLNGITIVVLRLQPIVATFASSLLFGGAALYVMDKPGGAIPSLYYEVYSGTIGGIPFVVAVLALVILTLAVVTKTAWYRQILAVGDNPTGAFQSGLPTIKIRMGNYLLSALSGGVAALLLVGETGSGDPLLGGSFALGSISAAVLGGTALKGGWGSPFGAILGALALGLVGNLIFFLRIPFEYQGIVRGAITLAALAAGVIASFEKQGDHDC